MATREGLRWATRATMWRCRRIGTRIRGAGIRVVDGGLEPDSGMVKVVPDRYGGDASHGRVLDRSVRRSRAAWHPGGAGECAAHQKRTRAKNRWAGMPMADKTAHLRAAARRLPTGAGDGKPAHDLA